MKYKLVIKRQDDSIYWIENFNTEEHMNNWLTEEKTRFYWDPTFVSYKYSVQNEVETLISVE